MAYALTAYAAGPVTATGETPVTLVTLNALASGLTAGATYMGIFSCEMLSSTTTGASANTLRITDGTNTYVTLTPGFKNVSSPQDKRAVGGVFRFQPGGSPADTDFSLTVLDNVSGTATSQNGRVSLLVLGPDDFSAVSSGGSQFSTTYNTYCTLNFTPATSGDYVLVAFASAASNGSGRRVWCKLVCASTTIEYIARAAPQGENPFLFVMPLSSLSGAQTATIQMRSDNIGTVTINDLAIFALRRDRFDEVFTTLLGSNDAGTQDTYTTALTNTQTPSRSADYLSVYAFGIEGGSATESVYGRMTDGGSTLAENINEPVNTVTDESAMMCGHHNIAAYTNSSRTWTIDRKSEVSGTTTRIRTNAAIAVFSLYGIGSISADLVESSTATDSFSATTDYPGTLSESATATDSFTVAGDLAGTLFESSTATDTFTSIGTFNETVAESANAVDTSASAGVIITTSIAEASDAQDVYEFQSPFHEYIVEGAEAEDTLSATRNRLTWFLSFADVTPPPQNQGPGNPGKLKGDFRLEPYDDD